MNPHLAYSVSTELPVVRTPLPGPNSRAIFERTDPHVTHGMTGHELVPFVEARKRGYLIEDVDGNTFADHIGGWGFGRPRQGGGKGGRTEWSEPQRIR